VLDVDAYSDTYGKVVGWSELPTAGNELHHFGWNACSSALCHQGHGNSGQPLERRYLIVPGLRSSRTYVLDTKPDPRNPQVVREIQAEELAAKAGYSRPHTVHCGPGIFLFNLGGANGNDGPGGVALLDHDTFDVIGAWEPTGATSSSATTAGGTSTTTPSSPPSGAPPRCSSTGSTLRT
jgi:selenium-binding protein 1